MEIKLEKAVTLLPFAFLLHNIEEGYGMEEWGKPIPSPIHTTVTTQQFIIAVTLFTVLGFIVIFVKSFYKSDKQFNYVATGFAGMLFLNVFFPHLIGTISFSRYVPGVITALFINLPLTAYILFKTFTINKLNLKEIVISSVIGALIGIMLVFIFLEAGSIISNI
ncbi:MAG: HXXEE domain-containing protein [Bacteroidetes bacterium]|nr:HXXEE domain-containing protein [Bacteroidota bacterium]